MVSILGLLSYIISPMAGGDETATEMLQRPGRADESHPVQASVVHHDRTVPHEVRLERQWSGYGCCAHYHCHWLC